MDFNIPIKGYNEGLSADKQPALTTGYMSNMYPRGTLEKKIRLVQMPGADKAFAAQIGGMSVAVIKLFSITVVN